MSGHQLSSAQALGVERLAVLVVKVAMLGLPLIALLQGLGEEIRTSPFSIYSLGCGFAADATQAINSKFC